MVITRGGSWGGERQERVKGGCDQRDMTRGGEHTI